MSKEMSQKQTRVCVLLAIHNGARFLPQQLESLRNQDTVPHHIIVGDDGSLDGSLKIIKDAFKDWDDCKLTIVEGPRQGSAANFLSLFEHVDTDSDFVALCDQDDVWLEGKLSAATERLSTSSCPSEPALYGSATWVCGPDLHRRKKSKKISVDLGFQHALVENYAGGNTMVMNRSAIDLVRKSLHLKSKVLVHDWWIYQLVTGAGGRAFYDAQPSTLYRQHDSNLIGDNGGWKGRINRLQRLARGDYKRWTEANLSVLRELSHLLTPTNATSVSDIVARRESFLWKRLGIIPIHQLKRQGAAGQIGLWLAVLLNRF